MLLADSNTREEKANSATAIDYLDRCQLSSLCGLLSLATGSNDEDVPIRVVDGLASCYHISDVLEPIKRRFKPIRVAVEFSCIERAPSINPVFLVEGPKLVVKS
jgi:hypothetical protein